MNHNGGTCAIDTVTVIYIELHHVSTRICIDMCGALLGRAIPVSKVPGKGPWSGCCSIDKAYRGIRIGLNHGCCCEIRCRYGLYRDIDCFGILATIVRGGGQFHCMNHSCCGIIFIQVVCNIASVHSGSVSKVPKVTSCSRSCNKGHVKWLAAFCGIGIEGSIYLGIDGNYSSCRIAAGMVTDCHHIDVIISYLSVHTDVIKPVDHIPVRTVASVIKVPVE